MTGTGKNKLSLSSFPDQLGGSSLLGCAEDYVQTSLGPGEEDLLESVSIRALCAEHGV